MRITIAKQYDSGQRTFKGIAPIDHGYPSHHRSIVAIPARGDIVSSDNPDHASTMPFHTVSRSDTLFTIARQHGFRSWRGIYEHPNNALLRQRRPDPMVLAPGDAVFVPDKEPREGVELDRSYGSQMIGGGKVLINRGAYGPYRQVHLFAHELGHALFLKHYKNTLGYVELDHDESDDNCVMSYIYDPDSPPMTGSQVADRPHYRPGQYDPEFCGKCNLKLRGWNIRSGDLPDRTT
jgi:hypothetical protein